MYASIQKWGNSRAVRLPKAILESLNLKENDRVEIVMENKQIILRPAKKDRLTLEEIFEDWDGEKYDSYDWGDMDAPVGRELI